MGGKKVPRTKNNAKPSNSSRTAELLGSSTPSTIFFGGLGLANSNDQDAFDANIIPELQIILRKLSKKDPMTKKKALQELLGCIVDNDVETLKTFLPLWPKHYQNLANDPEHNVRELSQSVTQLLMSKCNRNMAPYLKLLVPVWLCSRYDSYAPAASIATNSFLETFAASGANRTKEVCQHCQTEILEYVTRNITFHTASTMSLGKSLTPEEEEQKYQRVLVSSFKVISFLLQHVSSQIEEDIKQGLATLLNHQKFWIFAKHKLPAIRASWFECVYHILQIPLLDIVTSHKTQLISLSFQFIDEADPLVAPHIWGCVLLLQTNYNDWYSSLNMRKAVLPKLSTMLKNAFNRNASAICPNLLPFLANVTQESLQDLDILEFYKRFFDDLKIGIVGTYDPPLSKSDIMVIHNAYFECMRFLLQQMNQKEGGEEEQRNDFAIDLLQNHLLKPIAQLLSDENAHVKCFFQHTSALVAFWDRQCQNGHDKSLLYGKLLKLFWTDIFALVTENLAVQGEVNEHLLSNVLLLVQNLHVANPSLESPSVKFQEETESQQEEIIRSSKKETQEAAAFIQKELKQLAIKLVRICLDKAKISTNPSRYVEHIGILTRMFGDLKFYESLTESNEIRATLDVILGLLGNGSHDINKETCDSLMDIIFEVLVWLQPEQRFEYIEKSLLRVQHHYVQNLLLQRLLSYPLCTEPAVRRMLITEDICTIIDRIANEVVADNNRDKLNLLHKCFFQTDTGDILINAGTVDQILRAMSQPLEQSSNLDSETVEVCGSFIAQIMPVICSNANSSLAVRQEIFLKLFKFSLEHQPGDYLSEDTLWELTTCWQDALSSKDIEIDEDLLNKCAQIVEQLAYKVCDTEVRTAEEILVDSMAEAMAKFVICSTENIEDETTKLERIDTTLKALLTSPMITDELVHKFENRCVYLQALQYELVTGITAGSEFKSACFEEELIHSVIRRAALNFSTIVKLVCPVDTHEQQPVANGGVDDEITEDYCDPNENILKHWSDYLKEKILQCLRVAASADLWLEISGDLQCPKLDLVCMLSENVHNFMGNSSGLVDIIKDRLEQQALEQQCSPINSRLLGYLVHHNQYTVFEESATILLHEHLAEILTNNGSYKAYVMILQHLLPKLAQRSLGLSLPIMRTDPPEIWVKAAVFRCLIVNNFATDLNTPSDRNIIVSAVQFLTTIGEQNASQKDLLHYNVDLHKMSYDSVLNTVEFIKLLTEVLQRFPYELSIKNWDTIRIGLSSWILTLSKSLSNYCDPKISFFMSAVYQLFASLMRFIYSEKQKSSTEMLKNVIDEWDTLFAREVNVVLFKSFYQVTNEEANVDKDFLVCHQALLESIIPTLEFIDYSFIYSFCKSPNAKISLDHLCNYLLKLLHNRQYSVRLFAVHALRQLTPDFVADDIQLNEKHQSDLDINVSSPITQWHFLNRFEDYITRYNSLIENYLKEFTFKLTELDDLEPIDKHNALSYLLIWDCVLNACARSPVSLRAVYTNWLNENHYEENFLHFLFRAMPVDILKNHGAKLQSNSVFKELTWSQLKDKELSLERYACHLYTEVLRKLPAVVRKWWNTSQSRQKNFVDNLTTNYVSTLICSEELKAIANRKEKHENMQVTVHISTREVLAVYAIDEARMELVISLASNYPLGAVKVESGKQIGGRASSRNVGMQLTLLLTHQNGTIYDGLTMWKNNLDKKFEGVEECYVCYTVIHQDTCQLPKLTCKTCKKKFHGPCLYKWFTTSSKSTCPICRNVF
ncbi:uncharacterized protein Dwil_GK19431 [Drosophila willistoni]|uniref:E3 ubiquitin-protein ligase listerin n=1 Tax=Drosophila willistoni TaxID=7260 RepID=B4MXL3_DROWI|nr:E3 ubiquitin-protein ligase listerin [Drosophila willistoni]EDW76782.1 uncharacterized protein Dwil_GK19431 [Drosophila willistoni]